MSVPARMRGLAKGALKPTARALRRSVLPRLLPHPAHRWPERVDSVRIVGLLSSSSGLGQSARLCAGVLRNAGYEVHGADVSALYDSDDGLAFGPHRGNAPAQVSIFHLNPPMLLPSIIRSNPLRYWHTFNIGYWAWELETLPREWVRALRFVDAVMVPSTFCKRAVERHTKKPVLVVPHPVPVTDVATVQSADPFRVVSIFNFGSSVERKNPSAAIRAFRAAFGSNGDCELILKVSDGKRYPKELAGLRAEIGDAANIRLIDEVWDQGRLAALMRSARVYLSLHRSEGFGLTLAEAVAAGVPVVATNWSGNTDFCHPGASFVVDYTLVPVKERHRAFDGVGAAVWAEPSVEHAASQLRLVRANEGSARIAALRLREALQAYLAASTYDAAFARLAEAGSAERDRYQPAGLPEASP